MKSGSDIISSIHHLKMADEHMQSFQREHAGSKGASLFGQYRKKIEWIFKDLLSHPFLTDEVRAGIKSEINSDVFSVPAIHEKIAFLNPQQREFIETAIDHILSGEGITIEV